MALRRRPGKNRGRPLVNHPKQGLKQKNAMPTHGTDSPCFTIPLFLANPRAGVFFGARTRMSPAKAQRQGGTDLPAGGSDRLARRLSTPNTLRPE